MAKVVFKTVDEYLDAQTEQAVIALQRLRNTLKKLFPHLEEGISYSMPTLKYHRRMLVSYAGFKNHYSFFICSMKTANRLKPELKGVEIKGVTIQFDYNETIPQTLLKKIIRERMKETDEKVALKAKRKRQEKR